MGQDFLSEAQLLHRLGGPVRVMRGLGPWPEVEVVEDKKYAPPQGCEWGRAGNLAGGLCFSGPLRPHNEHYI